MVANIYSNIYLPNIKQYHLNPNKKPVQNSSVDVDPNGSNNKKKNLQGTDDIDNNRCVNKFLTSENPDINISDIIKDFKATMTHLGIPKAQGMQIIDDLKTAHIEASGQNPSISQVQQSLYNAATKVDGFVSQTIGKESTVVKQWVDALLMQKIDYKAYDPLPQEAIEKARETKIAEAQRANAMSNIVQSGSNVNTARGSIDSEFTTPAITTAIEINDVNNVIPTQNNVTHTPVILQQDNVTDITTQITQPNQKSQHKFHESRQLYFQAKNTAVEGKWNESLKIYEKTTEVATKCNDRKVLMHSYSDMAKINDKKHQLNPALKNYHEAIKIASSDKDMKTLAKLHYNVGSIYDDLNMFPQALNHYHASISFDGEINNPQGQAQTLNDVASLYASQYNHKDALDCYNIAFTMAAEQDDKEAQAHILSNIGTIFKQQNRPQDAIKFYNQSLRFDQSNEDIVGSTKTLINIGEVYESAGDSVKAHEFYNKAYGNARQINNADLKNIAYKHLMPRVA